MTARAMFEGLVYDEQDNLINVVFVGGEAHYVIDDDGFLRHVEAEKLDREVMTMFLSQLEQNKDLAVRESLRMLGSDDLFAKAAIESQIENVDVDMILRQGLPPQARQMLGMMGFRIVLNYRGELVRVDQPSGGLPDEF